MMTPNILFINPPNVPFSSHGILIEPIDTLSLASYIQSLSYHVSMLDMDVKKMLSTDLPSYLSDSFPDIMVIVFDYHIPLHDAGANQEIFNICQLAKKNGSFVILGGKAATFYPEDKLKQLGADLFIQHDMEQPLKEVLSLYQSSANIEQFQSGLGHIHSIRYFNHDQTLQENLYIKQSFDLNTLPIPNRDLLQLEDYIDVRTILSSRGCNLRCSFCHVPGFWGNWQGRSVESVINEIDYLVTTYHSQKILFLDDNAMAQPKRLSQIAVGLKERNIQVALGCLGTISSYRPEVIQSMYEGGFRWIHYGAESADNQQLLSMGKKIQPQQIIEATKGTQSAGLRVRTSWILDMPDLTLEGLLKTEEMILNHGANEIRLHFLTIRLGSLLYDKYQLDTPQFIHNSKPNLNISQVNDTMIEESISRIIQGLQSQGYTLVKNPNDFIDIEQLTQINPQLKIVSLCPLRYGLGWKI